MELSDAYGRRINYLRLSVTDRCNLRCRYCMPEEGVPILGHGEILTYEELTTIARVAVRLGIEKIRITGGEPLVRKGIIPFLAGLSGIPSLRHLALTTNGLLLDEMAEGLWSAGVQRLNISLDSLRHDTFAAITRGGDLNRVLAGLAAAERAGFRSLKVNMVVMRGINDLEILDFAALTLDRPYAVRFIEFMPTAGEKDWQGYSIPGSELLERISRHYPLRPVDKGEFAGPARDYMITGAAGTIGFITPIFCHFCSDCNRIRITSTGKAKGCLFSDEEFDLKPLLKSGDEAGLEEALRKVVSIKQDRHRITENEAGPTPFEMSKVGG